jgi:hypothetical protein
MEAIGGERPLGRPNPVLCVRIGIGTPALSSRQRSEHLRRALKLSSAIRIRRRIAPAPLRAE